MSEEHEGDAQHLRGIAEQIRRLAQEALTSEAEEELLDLAEEIDRMADCHEKRRKNAR
jgi:hypothetical protein